MNLVSGWISQLPFKVLNGVWNNANDAYMNVHLIYEQVELTTSVICQNQGSD